MPNLAKPVILVMLIGFVAPSATALQGKRHPAGWPNLLMPRQGYELIFEKPIVEPGENPKVYQQKARYVWTGGRLDELDVTFLRDPGVAKKYSTEAMKQEKEMPSGEQIRGKQTWLWLADPTLPKPAPITSRLVIVLAPDKAVILEQKHFSLDLKQIARELDFGKIEKALESPPKR